MFPESSECEFILISKMQNRPRLVLDSVTLSCNYHQKCVFVYVTLGREEEGVRCSLPTIGQVKRRVCATSRASRFLPSGSYSAFNSFSFKYHVVLHPPEVTEPESRLAYERKHDSLFVMCCSLFTVIRFTEAFSACRRRKNKSNSQLFSLMAVID